MKTTYDYIILGGGSAGCVMAARLSENPDVSVCLLEAGGSGKSWFHRMPMGILLTTPGWFKISNWAFRTEPQKGLNGRRGYQPRGRALGGSSAINAMLYVRGHQKDYDEWADLGCKGWDWKNVLPFFRKAERNHKFNGDLHGTDGPLHVGDGLSNNPINQRFYNATADMQIPYNEDFNGAVQEGVGPYQVTQFRGNEKHGERCSAAAAYLHPVMDRTNLDVITGARITKVLMDGKTATGAAYRKRGRTYELNATQDVIVSAGAFGSPQILQLSGIGPADELRKHGLPVHHDLPGVGENLQDHIDFSLMWKSKDPTLVGMTPKGLIDLIRAGLKWRKHGSGLGATTFSEAGGFIKTDPSIERPDCQLHLIIGIVDDHSRKIHISKGYSMHICLLRPKSRGSVRLKNANPMSDPNIDMGFLSADEDVTNLLKATKITRRIMENPAFESIRCKEIYLSGNETDAELIQQIRNRADTIYHPVGTCKMGTDPMAVVDPECRVHGVKGLRVVDASVMPRLIGGNTNAPTIMIAEKIANGMMDTKAKH